MANIKFQKFALIVDGKRIPVRYSLGSYTKESGLPVGTITIYAKGYGSQLPSELNVSNDSDSQSDYFDKDKARILPNSKYYSEAKKFV